MQAVLKSQGTELKFGDILIIRSGTPPIPQRAISLLSTNSPFLRLYARLQCNVSGTDRGVSRRTTPLLRRGPTILTDPQMDLGELQCCSRRSTLLRMLALPTHRFYVT
jgi:hypothetical protein